MNKKCLILGMIYFVFILLVLNANAVQSGLPTNKTVLFSCNMNAGDINGASLNCSLGTNSSYNGDIKGNPTSVAGVIDTAMRFDGTGDFVTINSTVAIIYALQNNFSIYVCASSTTTTANLRYWGIRNNVGGDYECLINRPSFGKIRCDAGQSDINYVDSTNGNSSKGAFYSLALVVNDTNGVKKAQMFYNGTEESTPTVVADFVDATDDVFTIGATQGGVVPFIGDIDQFYFFNKSLGGDEIAAMNTSTNGVCTPFSDLPAPPPPPSNSCTYSGSGDWSINSNDNCALTSTINLNGNKVSITGTGIVDLTITGKIINFFSIAVHGLAQLVCRNVNGCFG